jgi:hypothetical protein
MALALSTSSIDLADLSSLAGRIRALQLADLRARRVSGRHQISADGRHLIDGVPFGRPFSKRSLSSRPGITIPPRKKRRTLLPAWGRGIPDDEEDAEWEPTQDAGDQLALVPDNESSDEDGAARHDIGNTEEGSEGTESDADESGLDGEDLVGELEDLNEDLGSDAPTPEIAVHQTKGKHSLRRMPAIQENIEPALPTPPEPHPAKEKSVRFDEEKIPAPPKDASSDESDSSISESSCSDTSSDDDSDSDSSDSDSSDSDSSEDSDSDEDAYRAKRRKTNPPGRGSASTRKSNRRNKMRRRLGRLKELGALHEEADFAALRTFDDTHKGPIITPALGAKSQAKQEEQAEFEARRQKLLRDLESGGVDVDATSEKENVPPSHDVEEKPTEGGVVDQPASETADEPVKKRLDVTSFKRHLFGSLGVRTPRSKEDEEVTRKKLAGEPRQFQSQRETEETFEEAESEPEVDWQDKLILKATECVVDDIELTDPPFPFRQRWDFDAQNTIRQRKGLGKKRKRSRGRQLDGMADQAEYEDYGYADGEELNYDDNVFDGVEVDGNDEMLNYDDNAVDMEAEHDGDAADTDLPTLPDDLSSLADLVESEVKKGMIIAFKQLDMSKATNWQPRVSEYRVAETESDPEDGMFSIRLAKRDRTPREDVDDEEGERQYSGFEMPGYEDEDDDGFREVAFSDLIEPKLLRVVDPGVGNEEAS